MFYLPSPIFLVLTLFCQISFIVCRRVKSRNIDPRNRNKGQINKLILNSIELKIPLLEHYIHQLSVIVFGGHNNLFTLSILGNKDSLEGIKNIQLSYWTSWAQMKADNLRIWKLTLLVPTVAFKLKFYRP